MELKMSRKITPTVSDFELASLIKLSSLIDGLDILIQDEGMDNLSGMREMLMGFQLHNPEKIGN